MMSNSPESCDTFVALPSVTEKNCVIFAKNSDRHKDEVQEVVYFPAAEHGAGKKVQCTFIEIDQAPKTNAVFLSKPAWLWGAEMGSNDKGVAIGNEAIFTKELSEADLEERLIGMDLVRLGLERGSNAKEALDVITKLIQEHGQGGPCSEIPGMQTWTYHNSFIIADGIEAWVLETVGKHWAAEKVTEGVRNISNVMSIHNKIDAMSDGLKEFAKEKGYWDGSGDFDFAAVFSGTIPMKFEGPEVPSNRFTCGEKLMQDAAKDNNFNIRSMMKILRDTESGISRSGLHGPHATTSSLISVLQPPGGATPSCHWVTCTPNPRCSVFKPFVFCPDVQFGNMTISPTFPDDPAKVKPRFQKQVDRQHKLYKAHSTINPLPGDKVNKELVETLQRMEDQCIGDVEAFLSTFDPSKECELCDLFKDTAETEYKLYIKK